jgi:hypothetical protein
MSFPVALSGAVTNPAIALNASLPATPANSKFMAYDEAGQSGFTIISTRSAIGSGWSGGVPQVTPGTGFFIVNTGTTNRPWNINYTVQ